MSDAENRPEREAHLGGNTEQIKQIKEIKPIDQMGDSEDHPKRNDDPEHGNHPQGDTERPINFEWTPELVKIGTSRGAIHPSIGPIESHYGKPIYRPGMTLPDPADTRECLKWAGLSDKKIIEVEQEFNDLYPDYQGPACGYKEKHYPTGYNTIVFPKIEKMLDLFLQGMHKDDNELEYTHKGYIEHGIQLGLHLEFAIFCGLHKDDPRAIDNPTLFKRKWFDLGPTRIMSDTLIPFWMNVEELLAAKLVYEGKAWVCHGRCLVHNGESLAQSKARMNEQERERLKEQAAMEYVAEREREKQEIERLYAEEDAIWAEEDRQAEMLKQKSIEKAVQQKD
ncbi:hypothetical protein N7519_009207 [Penicillium mononematosum]|uniref:uncharacterized protein n=1 Tax=Penicillium mononematosum TaxID=268346 RepID=UPI0025469DFA|nr:uncharacterized protein N7519_009207 [Penicillium mononematosum]KAJ6178746.1 hypothetical protein N7519_009207 [Penicillium mononematosum]